MADFENAIKKLKRAEGGYVDNPNDYGGETNFGISKRQYPNLDIKNLTWEGAKAIYKRDYWDKMNLDYVNSQLVAEELFDTGVNQGWQTAGLYAQQVLNVLNWDSTTPRMKEDGLIGPRTLHAINNCKYPIALLKGLNGLQFQKYWDIVKRNPAQAEFFRIWLTRVNFNDMP